MHFVCTCQKKAVSLQCNLKIDRKLFNTFAIRINTQMCTINNKFINNKNYAIMEKKISELKDMISTDAKIIVEVKNNLNIIGISYLNNCYVVSWYNKIIPRDRHYMFDTLSKAQNHFNLIMELQF